jgi:hypothetical protein
MMNALPMNQPATTTAVLSTMNSSKTTLTDKEMRIWQTLSPHAHVGTLEQDNRAIECEPPSKRSRRVKTFIDPITHLARPITPRLSHWWILYIEDPKVNDPHWNKQFRNRFRLPYESYLDLLHHILEVENDSEVIDPFSRWRDVAKDDESKKKKAKVSPIELLVLGSLRYLGRGWTFDDLEESTYIARDVHRVFFHKFVEFGAKFLYPIYVITPSTLEELKECELEYRKAGFPGCIGSTDATHINMDKTNFGVRQAHLGFKSKGTTTRTFNLTVNHRRRIIHSTTGHPGRWNDKTLIKFDGLMDQLKRGLFNSTMSFELQTRTGHSISINGCYVIVDNGYLQWSTTVPPHKSSSNRSELRFSQWLKSLRKDVECTFGILKGCWRILKTGIRLHNTEIVDNIWMTCCALHNMLLDVDGLSAGWQNGVPSRWESESGQFDDIDVPESIRKLIDPNGINPRAVSTYDTSFCGFMDVDDDNNNYESQQKQHNDNDDQHEEVELGNERSISVNDLSLTRFHEMLVEHFNILFHDNKIIWPRRLPEKPRNFPPA